LSSKRKITFFLDQNVPISVGHALSEAAHKVVFLREWLAEDAADPLVARVAEVHGAVLVSHDSDFRKIAPRIPRGERARFRKLDNLRLECPEPQAANRVRCALSFIEAEYGIAHADGHVRMIVSIGTTVLRTHR
jgi:predicted nuclease of predicted toxin-antitoxin system